MLVVCLVEQFGCNLFNSIHYYHTRVICGLARQIYKLVDVVALVHSLKLFKCKVNNYVVFQNGLLFKCETDICLNGAELLLPHDVVFVLDVVVLDLPFLKADAIGPLAIEVVAKCTLQLQAPFYYVRGPQGNVWLVRDSVLRSKVVKCFYRTSFVNKDEVIDDRFVLRPNLLVVFH